jgi:hypothetical protein
MQIPYIQTGLERAGFQSVAVGVPPAPGSARLAARVAPNPFRAAATIHLRLPAAGVVRAEVFDAAGRRVERLADGEFPAGDHALSLRGEGLGAGLYLVRIEGPGGAVTLRCVRLE